MLRPLRLLRAVEACNPQPIRAPNCILDVRCVVKFGTEGLHRLRGLPASDTHQDDPVPHVAEQFLCAPALEHVVVLEDHDDALDSVVFTATPTEFVERYPPHFESRAQDGDTILVKSMTGRTSIPTGPTEDDCHRSTLRTASPPPPPPLPPPPLGRRRFRRRTRSRLSLPSRRGEHQVVSHHVRTENTVDGRAAPTRLRRPPDLVARPLATASNQTLDPGSQSSVNLS